MIRYNKLLLEILFNKIKINHYLTKKLKIK